jgi:hypothetical protein
LESFPIDFIAFFDTGVAWQDNDKAWFLDGGRKMISSTGIGLRTNFFGYLILGLDYVYPFDRPQKGWHFQFTFSPGF